MTDIKLLQPDWPDLPAVKAFVSCRTGGVSEAEFASLNPAAHVGDQPRAVAENRQRLAQILPGEPALQWLHQVHGKEVLILDAPGPVREADGAITRVPGLACCVMTADCLPVFLASVSRPEVGLVHGGWRGLAAGILEQAVAGFASRPEDIRAWLGPAIGPCHFEVGAEVKAAFLQGNEPEELETCFSKATAESKFMADLYGIARFKLAALGIHQVSGGGHCSFCEPGNFYSYRRDGRTGRNLNVIYLQG